MMEFLFLKTYYYLLNINWIQAERFLLNYIDFFGTYLQHKNRISEWKKYWMIILDRSSADVTDVMTAHNFVCMEKHRSQQGETEKIY